MRVVATAGHVDHGKSSLVRALTGTDPDRFPEEKSRGLTIDLGFAFTTLPSGVEIGFVDVPGHTKFVKNMLAGVGAIEVAMLVVAANEGWMPQTEEHARILGLLDVRYGLVVITKADIVDSDVIELARLEIAEHLRGSALAAWPVVVADSSTRRGLDDVRSTLTDVLARAPESPDRRRPRLWVDRVFAVRGAGTVVTGTLAGGGFSVGDEVLVEPHHRPARIRAIETHGEPSETAAPGSRVALNLAGIEHRAVTRGDAVVLPDQWAVVDHLDARVEMVGTDELRTQSTVDAHVGSGAFGARARVLAREPLTVRLRLDQPLPLAPGDRIVLRSSGRRSTLGGAEILDVAPARRTDAAVERLSRPLPERVILTRPWLAEHEIMTLAGLDREDARAFAAELVAAGAAERIGPWLVGKEPLNALRERAARAASEHHMRHPLEPGVDLAALAMRCGVTPAQLRGALQSHVDVVVEREIVKHATHVARTSDLPEGRRLLDALVEHPFSPPTSADLGIDLTVERGLIRDGDAVELDGVVFATSALADARRRVSEALRARDALSIADIRDVLASTRKFVVPIVNYLDAEGVTRRRGDERVAGPRAEVTPSGA